MRAIVVTDERVMGFADHGGAYAERIAVRRDTLLPLPAGWTAAQGAAFPVNYFTAYFAYWIADVKPGERVLIHAAGGGVGTAAVELGRIFKVETFGTSSSDEKLSRLKGLGLGHGINYRTGDYEKVLMDLTGGEGVDVVFEMLGGEHTAKSSRCLRQLGRVVIYGTATGRQPQVDFFSLFSKNASVHGLWLTPLARIPGRMEEAWAEMSDWIEEGSIQPVVGHTLPLDQAGEAHRLLLERKNYGKVVLEV